MEKQIKIKEIYFTLHSIPKRHYVFRIGKHAQGAYFMFFVDYWGGNETFGARIRFFIVLFKYVHIEIKLG